MEAKKWALGFCLAAVSLFAEDHPYGVSGNPGAVNVLIGTVELGN